MKSEPAFLDIAREVFPDVPQTPEGDSKLTTIALSYTGYPAFWHTDDPAREFRQQLEAYRNDPEGVAKRLMDALDAAMEDVSNETPDGRCAACGQHPAAPGRDGECVDCSH